MRVRGGAGRVVGGGGGLAVVDSWAVRMVVDGGGVRAPSALPVLFAQLTLISSRSMSLASTVFLYFAISAADISTSSDLARFAFGRFALGRSAVHSSRSSEYRTTPWRWCRVGIVTVPDDGTAK